MDILAVNDDGIHAKGLKAIAKRLAQNHNVTVVAPQSERSATSHSITIYRPLRVKRIEADGLENIPCYIIDGQPVDCVKIGISHLMKSGVDLVVSGINHGSNIGSDMLYSGTVSAALDAVIMGYKAIAVSISSIYPKNIESAVELTSQIIDSGLIDTQPDGILYNLNVPDLPLCEIKGIKATRQGRTVYEDAVDIRSDPRGREYIWVTGKLEEYDEIDDTDVSCVKQGYASITPVKFDLTAKSHISGLECKIKKLKFIF